MRCASKSKQQETTFQQSVHSAALDQGIQLPAASQKSGAGLRNTHRARGRKVTFARGPLLYTKDGHPAHEGVVARPVRSFEKPWGKGITKKEVLLIEELLSDEDPDIYRHSIEKLKRKCGLLPALKSKKGKKSPTKSPAAAPQQQQQSPSFKQGGASTQEQVAIASQQLQEVIRSKHNNNDQALPHFNQSAFGVESVTPASVPSVSGMAPRRTAPARGRAAAAAKAQTHQLPADNTPQPRKSTKASAVPLKGKAAGRKARASQKQEVRHDVVEVQVITTSAGGRDRGRKGRAAGGAISDQQQQQVPSPGKEQKVGTAYPTTQSASPKQRATARRGAKGNQAKNAATGNKRRRGKVAEMDVSVATADLTALTDQDAALGSDELVDEDELSLPQPGNKRRKVGNNTGQGTQQKATGVASAARGRRGKQQQAPSPDDDNQPHHTHALRSRRGRSKQEESIIDHAAAAAEDGSNAARTRRQASHLSQHNDDDDESDSGSHSSQHTSSSSQQGDDEEDQSDTAAGSDASASDGDADADNSSQSGGEEDEQSDSGHDASSQDNSERQQEEEEEEASQETEASPPPENRTRGRAAVGGAKRRNSARAAAAAPPAAKRHRALKPAAGRGRGRKTQQEEAATSSDEDACASSDDASSPNGTDLVTASGSGQEGSGTDEDGGDTSSDDGSGEPVSGSKDQDTGNASGSQDDEVSEQEEEDEEDEQEEAGSHDEATEQIEQPPRRKRGARQAAQPTRRKTSANRAARGRARRNMTQDDHEPGSAPDNDTQDPSVAATGDDRTDVQHEGEGADQLQSGRRKGRARGRQADGNQTARNANRRNQPADKAAGKAAKRGGGGAAAARGKGRGRRQTLAVQQASGADDSPVKAEHEQQHVGMLTRRRSVPQLSQQQQDDVDAHGIHRLHHEHEHEQPELSFADLPDPQQQQQHQQQHPAHHHGAARRSPGNKGPRRPGGSSPNQQVGKGGARRRGGKAQQQQQQQQQQDHGCIVDEAAGNVSGMGEQGGGMAAGAAPAEAAGSVHEHVSAAGQDHGKAEDDHKAGQHAQQDAAKQHHARQQQQPRRSRGAARVFVDSALVTSNDDITSAGSVLPSITSPPSVCAPGGGRRGRHAGGVARRGRGHVVEQLQADAAPANSAADGNAAGGVLDHGGNPVADTLQPAPTALATVMGPPRTRNRPGYAGGNVPATAPLSTPAAGQPLALNIMPAISGSRGVTTSLYRRVLKSGCASTRGEHDPEAEPGSEDTAHGSTGALHPGDATAARTVIGPAGRFASDAQHNGGGNTITELSSLGRGAVVGAGAAGGDEQQSVRNSATAAALWETLPPRPSGYRRL